MQNIQQLQNKQCATNAQKLTHQPIHYDSKRVPCLFKLYAKYAQTNDLA